MNFESPVVITGPDAPLQVSSQVMCQGLNVEFLGGYRASAFAQLVHPHKASDVTEGVFNPSRLGSRVGELTGKFLGVDGSGFGEWRKITVPELAGITQAGIDLVAKTSPDAMRDYLVAAAAVHEHSAARITSGTFPTKRLGGISNGVISSSYVLRGAESADSAGYWGQLAYTDVSGAAGFSTSTVGRLPIWSAAALLGSSPVYVSSGFVGIASGSAFAVDDNQFYVGGVKLPKPPSDTQLYGLRAGGATGASWEVVSNSGLPALPTEDGPYVLVRESGVFTWRKLVGDGVGIN